MSDTATKLANTVRMTIGLENLLNIIALIGQRVNLTLGKTRNC
jgi:hypothetical protein